MPPGEPSNSLWATTRIRVAGVVLLRSRSVHRRRLTSLEGAEVGCLTREPVRHVRQHDAAIDWRLSPA